MGGHIHREFMVAMDIAQRLDLFLAIAREANGPNCGGKLVYIIGFQHVLNSCTNSWVQGFLYLVCFTLGISMVTIVLVLSYAMYNNSLYCVYYY